MSVEVFSMKVISAMEKVLPEIAPSGDGSRTKLSAMKGETVSFQIAYHWSGMWKKRGCVQVEAPEGVSVRIRKVELVPVSYATHMGSDEDYISKKPGMYPDLLRDMDEHGFNVISGQWRSIWVDLSAEEAGEYPVKLTLKWLDEETVIGEAEVSLEVLPAELPELAIPHTEWVHCDCLANYYNVEVFSEEHWRIVENFIALAVKRGINMILTPIFTPPLDTALGGERRTVQLIDVTVTENGYEFGFDKLRRWVEMCRRCHVKFYEISHLFSQWGAFSTPKVIATRDGKEEHLFGWHTKATSEEYTTFLQTLLPQLLDVLKELGVDKQCYFHISDEPHFDHMETYGAARAIVRDILKDYSIIDALSDYEFYKSGLVDAPICASDHIEPFLENRPEKLWTYYCTGQYIDVSNRYIAMPGYRTRILGAQLYKFRIDGFLQWGHNFYNSEHSRYAINPFANTDSDATFPGGDPFVVYPGADGEPMDSIRNMYMCKAFEDLRALNLLESLAGRETAMKCLNEEQEGEMTFKNYPRTAEYIQGMRERVNQEIAKCL